VHIFHYSLPEYLINSLANSFRDSPLMIWEGFPVYEGW
jgi:hypothetical protein